MVIHGSRPSTAVTQHLQGPALIGLAILALVGLKVPPLGGTV